MNGDRPFNKKRSTASSFSEFQSNKGGSSRPQNRDNDRGGFKPRDGDRPRFNDRAPSGDNRGGFKPRDGGRPSYNNNRSEGRSFTPRDGERRDGPRPSYNNRTEGKPFTHQGDNRGADRPRFNDRAPSGDGGRPSYNNNRGNDRPSYNNDRPRFNDRAPQRSNDRGGQPQGGRFNDRPPRNVDRSGNQGYERKRSFNQEPARRTFGKKEIRDFRLQGIFEYGNDFCTPNAVPGQSVYGERFCKDAKGVEYRIWDPKRSKLGAALKKGVSQIGIKPGSTVLYLGCSTGTTVSHVGEIIGKEGQVYALDVAPRVLRDLLFTTAKRENIYPIMADASKPAAYAHAVPQVDVIFMDIAQKDQVGIFLKNVRAFLKPGGFGLLSLKSRSVDIAKRPVQVFKESRIALEKETVIVDYKELDPYEIDHAFFVVKKKGDVVEEKETPSEPPLPENLKPELN